MIRKILMTVVGHVDHGKSSILDRIRGTSIVEKEAGLITQAIGASVIPIEKINQICGTLLKTLKMEITVPGIVAIDTPGHAAFTHLRKRGGSLADISVVVVDINEGFMPQTIEAIEILKQCKTPFIIAANKIDLLPGWTVSKGMSLLENISHQKAEVKQLVETKVYELVGQLFSKFGMNAERFDRVSDFTKTIGIVPLSAETGEGIPELLMMIVGLAQKYLENDLKCNTQGPAKGTILEVKEEKGVGQVLDAILYDGHLRANDIIIIGGVDVPIIAKVKALFEPAPLAEMRDKKTRFSLTREVAAATGVRISAKEAEKAISGMPFESVLEENIDIVKERVQGLVEEVVVETDEKGVVVKADALGSLEAIINLLREKNIPIRKAAIGNITKKDIADAESNLISDPLFGVVLGFNVAGQETTSQVKIITNDVIYRLVEELEKWQTSKKKAIEQRQFEEVTRPFKIEFLRGYTFRQNNPAVFGVVVLEGTLKAGVQIMKADGKILSEIKSIQSEQETVEKVEKNRQAAVSVPHITIGRQLAEGNILYSFIPEEHFRKLREFKQFLSDGEKELLKEIAAIMRKNNPLWGI